MQPINQQYDAFGNNVVPQQYYQTPPSNVGLIYQPANVPFTPGTILPGQTIASLTFQSGYSQRRIRITMNPYDNPIQGAASIMFIDENGNPILILADPSNPANGAVITVLDRTTHPAINVIGVNGSGRNTNLVTISEQDTGNTNQALYVEHNGSGDVIRAQAAGGYPLSLLQSVVLASHFKIMTIMNGVTIVKSDGTSPNGVLSGVAGDFCLNGTGGHPFWCSGGTTWTQI